MRRRGFARFWGKIEGLQRVPDSRDEIVISKRPWRGRVSDKGWVNYNYSNYS